MPGISLFCITFVVRIINAITLNLELFIARRLLRGKGEGTASASIVRFAVAGIALGICVMLLSVFVVKGFKKEITDKLSGFFAHVEVTAADAPVVVSDSLLALLRAPEEVVQAAPYATKPTVLKSPSEIHGMLLRGVDSLYSPAFYERHLKEGRFPDFSGAKASTEILLSAAVARVLDVGVGEKLTAYFVQEPVRMRAFTVVGIYDTGFKEYDEMFALCDIRQLQRLNGWQDNEVTGMALELEEMEAIPEVRMELEGRLGGDDAWAGYRVTTLQELAPQIFDWLSLLNMNVVVILTLIMVVAGFNMVSGLLILILDKTALIGILKTLGVRNVSLRKIFLYIAMGLIVRGMIAGNCLALLLGGVQAAFRLIALNPDMYYMDTVPVVFNVGVILLLNAGVLVLSVLMLLVPAMLISRILPIKVLRFE